MRVVACLLLLSLAWTACTLAGSAQPVRIELGTSFSLTPGQFAQWVGRSGSGSGRGDSLRVGFVGVTADSRCPKSEQCVWAGDATVQVWLQQASGPKQTRELRAAVGAGQAASAFDHELQLLRLDPYPVAGKPIATERYVATLTLTPQRTPGAAPER